MTKLASFSLESTDGALRNFPAERPALVAFVKEDCPTCNTVMPLLEAFRRAAPELAWLVLGQDSKGTATLEKRFDLGAPLLDDDALKVSFGWDIEIVPTLFLAAADGTQLARLEGFSKTDWQEFAGQLAEFGATPEIDWTALPDWRPGCGSRSVDPLIAERLQAEADNSPLRARRIEVAPADDEAEFLFDQGVTDGLPVVPPTPERVLRMLAGTRRDAQQVVATVPPNMAPATVEKVAINAVMAGCRPEYLPLVIAALQAACTDEFNVHGVMATTMGASPVMVVNGPIRERLGMNMGLGALGRGSRANAAPGRALRLCLQNIGGSRAGGTDRSTLASPMKFTLCFPEFEERSNWSPLHVERGFSATDSVVTLYPGTGFQQLVDQHSRTARQLAGSFAMTMRGIHHPRAHGMFDCLLVVCPEHVDTLATDGFSKADLRRHIQTETSVPLSALAADDRSGEGMDPARLAAMPEAQRSKLVPKFRSDEMIHIVVAGGEAGKFSGLIHGWVGGDIGSMPTSMLIES